MDWITRKEIFAVAPSQVIPRQQKKESNEGKVKNVPESEFPVTSSHLVSQLRKELQSLSELKQERKGK
jgi:hypothetical protein